MVTKSRGFTLIELLVVIAIIGILSAIVLASLNSAREKGREAAIRSTLKSMSQQIELMRNDNADYRFVNTCANAGDPLKKFVDALEAQGASVGCYSLNLSSRNDLYLRWGVTAALTDEPTLTAWSASPAGVVRWDTAASGSGIWDVAMAVCSAAGKRSASYEEWRTLSLAFDDGIPPGMTSGFAIWTSTESPKDPDTIAYRYKIPTALIDEAKTASRNAWCVS